MASSLEEKAGEAGVLTMTNKVFFPFYIGDYLKDTQHLDAEGHGAYCLAMFHCYMHDSLPENRKKLRNICRTQDDEVIDEVLEFFNKDGDEYRHKRVDAEKERAKDFSKQQSEKGKKSAEAKKAKKQKDINHGSKSVGKKYNQNSTTAQPDSNQGSTEGQPEGNPSHSHSHSLSQSPSHSDDFSDSDESLAESKASGVPIEKMKNVWNEICGSAGLPTIRTLTNSRKDKMRVRWRSELECSLDLWRRVCELVTQSGHHTGENNRGWKADIDFLLQPNRITQFLERDEASHNIRQIHADSQNAQFNPLVADGIDDEVRQQWFDVCSAILKDVGVPVFRSWFSNLELFHADESEVCLAAPSKFVAEWLRSHYVDLLERHWAGVSGRKLLVKVQNG